MVDQLIEYINRNAKLHPPPKELEFLYIWRPILRQKLYTYLTVVIHIGLHIKTVLRIISIRTLAMA